MGEVDLQKNENDKLFSQVASRLNLERKKLQILRDNNPDKSVFDALLEENGLVDYFIFKSQYSNMVNALNTYSPAELIRVLELAHNEVGEEPVLDEEEGFAGYRFLDRAIEILFEKTSVLNGL